MKKLTLLASIVSLTLLVSGCSVKEHEQAGHSAHWDYSKYGPEHWGDISGACKTGLSQSPINIIPAESSELNSVYEINFEEDVHTDAKIYDNGHSIKVVPSKGGKITLQGKVYKLIQFHFHGRSEHTIDGRQYDMVVHMVHQASDKTLAVVAVFYEVGQKNIFIQKIIENVGKVVEIDPQELLPKDVSRYYHYVGSLTTPPCSENVQWYILKDTDTISSEQLKKFRKFYEDNERPVQPINSRHIESK